MESSGYWLPHTSSVDFCEPNYFVSDYVVEFHNTWSSMLITMLAIAGYLYGNPTKEHRFSVMYIILGTVGIGSTALHCTMHWFFQSSDEIPMLWLSLCCLYGLFVMNEEKQSNKTKTYGWIFSVVGVLQTVVYYKFQQLYASFIIAFILSSIFVTTWTGYLAFYEPSAAHAPIRRLLYGRAFLFFVACGATVWLVDFHLCAALMPYYEHTTGFTLHVLWHCFSCLGTYYIILFLVAVRMQVLKQDPQVDYLWGFVPICTNVHALDKVT